MRGLLYLPRSPQPLALPLPMLGISAASGPQVASAALPEPAGFPIPRLQRNTEALEITPGDPLPTTETSVSHQQGERSAELWCSLTPDPWDVVTVVAVVAPVCHTPLSQTAAARGG